jgi:PAS domain S-box-containing protein/putative nucleotidyltransferase with HDIG domain
MRAELECLRITLGDAEIGRVQSSASLQDRLRALNRVSRELTVAEDPDSLCRMAIELGRSVLGFDRLSIWIVVDDPDVLYGVYGTGEDGSIRDEHYARMSSPREGREAHFAGMTSRLEQSWPLLNETGDQVGRGWHIEASLWDGEYVIGVLNVDNLITHQPLNEHDVEIVGLYGAFIGHSLSRLRLQVTRHESEQRFAEAFEHAPLGMTLVSADLKFLSVNRQFSRLLGYEPEEMIGRHVYDYTHPDDIPREEELTAQALSGRIPRFEQKKRYLRRDGSIAYGQLVATLVRDKAGVPMYGLGMIQDISEQRRAQEEIDRLVEDLRHLNADLIRSYDATIQGLIRALDLRDSETEGHSERVAAMTVELARRMGVAEDTREHLRRGALLHDIGKVGIPDRILSKPEPLTSEEWIVMRRHPTYAYEMLRSIAFLEDALDIPLCHHEKWDGTGYPRGLAGEEIPFAARIFAITDVWDALASDRPYRPRWSRERVLAHVAGLSGSHFDPRVVEAFLAMLADSETDTGQS